MKLEQHGVGEILKNEPTATVTHEQFSLSIFHVDLEHEAFTVGLVDLSHRLHLKPAADICNRRSDIFQRDVLLLVL